MSYAVIEFNEGRNPYKNLQMWINEMCNEYNVKLIAVYSNSFIFEELE